MTREPSDSKSGGYKISEGPVTSSSLSRRKDEARDELLELPTHYGKPLLVAIARDPRTLFVCWSVDWSAAFDHGLPADRCAYVRLREGGSEKTIAVEPMVGGCAIEDLQPGETYSVELGYYAPPDTWNSIVVGNEVMMPFAAEGGDELVDVATVPFHLTFERMLNALRGADSSDLAQRLAEFQERAATKMLTREESEILRALDLSPEDLQKTAAASASLEKSQRLSARAPFGGASPSDGFGGASWGGS
jgi:Domain of unknown function (DUF4912)